MLVLGGHSLRSNNQIRLVQPTTNTSKHRHYPPSYIWKSIEPLSVTPSRQLYTPSEANYLFAIPGFTVAVGASLFVAARAGIKRLFRRGRGRRKAATKMEDGSIARFSVCTFNIRGVMDRWAERKPVLQRCLKDMDADVICFQECLTGEYGQDKAILDSSYHVFSCKAALFNLLDSTNTALRWYARSVSGLLSLFPFRQLMIHMPASIEAFREKYKLESSFFRLLRDLAIAPFFGNSVACRLSDAHEIKHSTLVLGDWRAAQRIEFELGNGYGKNNNTETSSSYTAVHHDHHHHIKQSISPKALQLEEKFKVWVVNMHLDHEHPDNRQSQALRIAKWMEDDRGDDCAAVVLCGDFNGPPSEPFHAALQYLGYKSGYKLRHGKEPEGTWPSGIQAPLMDHGPFECLDYVYVWTADGYETRVIEAQLYGNTPDEKDRTLYASDHVAVKVLLEIEKVGSPVPAVDEKKTE